MPTRRPQINFQVDDAMKLLYDQAKQSGHWVTRLCSAGLLMMVEQPALRARALERLRDWEIEYQGASADEIHDFVQGAEAALRRAAPGTRRAPATRPPRKTARRARSE